MKNIPVIQDPPSAAPEETSNTAGLVADAGRTAALTPAIMKAISTVFDPEIPVNIVDLGLVYLCEITPADAGRHLVNVKMTLTAPGCGMGPVLASDVRGKIMSLPGVQDANVDVVFDPVWDRSMMSEAARLQLGMMW